MKRTLFNLFLIPCIYILVHCEVPSNPPPSETQHLFISNYACNNQSELEHIKSISIRKDTLFFNSKMDNVFSQINSTWIIGQGTGEIYYDTGKENLFNIIELNKNQRWIRIHTPELFNNDFALVFWRIRKNTRPLLNIKGSWGFSKIIFDSLQNEYQTHLFECDNNSVNLYIAHSKNLVKWTKDTFPILTPNQFIHSKWNHPFPDKSIQVTPLISDVVKFNGQFYCFAYGDDLQNKTYISLLISDSLNGNYQILDDAILSPNPKSDGSNHDVYMPRVIRIKNQWVMFYTGKNSENEESIYRATSTNLKNWITKDRKIIHKNSGWNENPKNQLVSNLEYVNDTLYIWCTGTKLTEGFPEKLNKGNVLDISIGKFYSIDEGNTFKACKGNPIFGGNVNSDLENDHIGAPLQVIKRNDSTFTFYHAKGIKNNQYTLMLEIN